MIYDQETTANCAQCGKVTRGNYVSCSKCGKTLCDRCDVRGTGWWEEPHCADCKSKIGKENLSEAEKADLYGALSGMEGGLRQFLASADEPVAPMDAVIGATAKIADQVQAGAPVTSGEIGQIMSLVPAVSTSFAKIYELFKTAKESGAAAIEQVLGKVPAGKPRGPKKPPTDYSGIPDADIAKGIAELAPKFKTALAMVKDLGGKLADQTSAVLNNIDAGKTDGAEGVKSIVPLFLELRDSFGSYYSILNSMARRVNQLLNNVGHSKAKDAAAPGAEPVAEAMIVIPWGDEEFDGYDDGMLESGGGDVCHECGSAIRPGEGVPHTQKVRGNTMTLTSCPSCAQARKALRRRPSKAAAEPEGPEDRPDYSLPDYEESMPTDGKVRDAEGRLVSVRCRCGSDVDLTDLGGKDTSCSKCGRDYNSSGQELDLANYDEREDGDPDYEALKKRNKAMMEAKKAAAKKAKTEEIPVGAAGNLPAPSGAPPIGVETKISIPPMMQVERLVRSLKNQIIEGLK